MNDHTHSAIMNRMRILIGTLLVLCFASPASRAQPDGDGFGQIIHINTRLGSFVGNPAWLLIIRDVDHDQNIPYLYDIRRGDNNWLAFTYSNNYLITVSSLQIETYRSRYNQYKKWKIQNFCHLESDGKIIRGESMYLTIVGDLTKDPDTVRCTLTRFPSASSLHIINP